MDERYRRALEAVRGAGRGEQSESSIRRAQAEADELLAAVQELREREAEATDDTGTVTCRVRGTGEVVSVYLSPQAIRDLTAEELGAQCVQAVAAARVLSARTWQELAAPGDAEGIVDLPDTELGDPHAVLSYWRRATREPR